MLRAIMATSNDPIPLILRLTLGGVMFPHGAQKALGMFGGAGIDGTVDFFRQSLGIPAPLTYLLIAAEFLGSIGLILGCLGRVAALGIGVVMVGAISKVHLANGFFMNWSGTQAGEGYEYHLLAIGIAVALVIRGSGALSIDRGVSPSIGRGV